MKKLLAIVVLHLVLLLGNSYAGIVKLKPCSETGWSEPCKCVVESNYAKKKYCNFKMNIKKSDIESICARKMTSIVPELRKKMFKSCMTDYGF